MANKIKTIRALEILDSRGNPTVEVAVELSGGIVGVASCPSGASTGVHEALELRDNDKKRYAGKGVLTAVQRVEKEIAPKLMGKDATRQKEIDRLMIKLDGTKNKSRLGANAILAVSLALCHAAAKAQGLPLYQHIRNVFGFKAQSTSLPVPMFNIINGGKHADSGLSFQEFLLIPKRRLFKENLRMGAEIFHALKEVLQSRKLSTLVGDEGGYAPRFSSHREAAELILEACEKSGYKLGKDVVLGIDAAASEFYNAQDGTYRLSLEEANLNTDQLVGLYTEWMDKFFLYSIEDPFGQDDWQGWRKITEKLGKSAMLVGDDLFVTNIERFKRGIKEGVANAILIKPNQIGTLTQTMECIKLAQKHAYKVIVSHRSGETADATVADLSVAVNADYIKAGSLSRGERLAKYNRLLEIEAGWNV